MILSTKLADAVEAALIEYWWKPGAAEYIGYGMFLIIAIIVVVKLKNFLEK